MTSPTPAPVSLGLIGLGNMGSVHARNLRRGDAPSCRLAAVCDLLPERLAAHADLPRFTDPVALLDSGLVEAVLIATPHYAHTTLGIEALRRGLHVLVEKPVAVHKADALRMIEAHQAAVARGPAPVLAAMFQTRLHPAYRRLRELLRSGELGRVYRFQWTVTQWFRTQNYYDSGDWRATWVGEGGGLLLNQCPHQLDLLQWLFGMPCRVHALCRFGRYHRIETEDDVSATLEYADGSHATFISSTGEGGGRNRLEIACQRGNLVLEDGRLQWNRTEQPVDEWTARCPLPFWEPPAWRVEIPVSSGPAGSDHMRVVENFGVAIRRGESLVAPAAEGLASVELANAMLLSAWTDRAVELPLDAAAYEVALGERIRRAPPTPRRSAPAAEVADLAQSYSR